MSANQCISGEKSVKETNHPQLSLASCNVLNHGHRDLCVHFGVSALNSMWIWLAEEKSSDVLFDKFPDTIVS